MYYQTDFTRIYSPFLFATLLLFTCGPIVSKNTTSNICNTMSTYSQMRTKKACKFQCANDLLGSQVYSSQKKTSTVIFKFDSLCKRLHGNERYFKGVQLQKVCKILLFVSPSRSKCVLHFSTFLTSALSCGQCYVVQLTVQCQYKILLCIPPLRRKRFFDKLRYLFKNCCIAFKSEDTWCLACSKRQPAKTFSRVLP